MLRPLSLLVLASLALAAPAQNLVQDFGFEQHGAYDPATDSYAFGPAWTSSTPILQAVFSPLGDQQPSQGTYFAALGGAGTLSQAVATQAGATYTVAFDLRNYEFSRGTSNSLTTTFGSGSLALTNVAESAGYARYTFQATAAGGSTALSFAQTNGTDFFFLDNVSVTQDASPAVPGPAAAASFGLLALRRRKRA